MSEFIRLQANGADAYPDASTENTYRPNGTSVESSLVNLESNVTTLGGVAGEAKTLAEQNSVKIATAEQEISDINSSLNSNLNMRYNPETDMVEIFYNDRWNEWMSGGLSYLNVLDIPVSSWVLGNASLSSTLLQISGYGRGTYDKYAQTKSPYDFFTLSRKYLHFNATLSVISGDGTFGDTRYTYGYIQLSKDGTNWETVKSYTCSGSRGATSGSITINEVIDMSAYTLHKYIRFYTYTSETNNIARFNITKILCNNSNV